MIEYYLNNGKVRITSNEPEISFLDQDRKPIANAVFSGPGTYVEHNWKITFGPKEGSASFFPEVESFRDEPDEEGDQNKMKSPIQITVKPNSDIQLVIKAELKGHLSVDVDDVHNVVKKNDKMIYKLLTDGETKEEWR